MDERRLKQTLQNIDVPESDENAKKRAINLALAEYDEAQKSQTKKSEKNSQGLSFLSRLIGNSKTKHGKPDDRRENMFGNKKMVYGGMATAMALVLVTAVTLQQPETTTLRSQMRADSAGGNTFSSIAKNITTSKLVPHKERSGGSATPTPIGGSAERMLLAEERHRPVIQRPSARKMANADIATPQSAPAMVESLHLTHEQKAYVNAPGSPFDKLERLKEVQQQYKEVGRDQFEDFEESPIKLVSGEPVSTFSIDVDTASYSFVRRQLNNGVLPQKDSVRIEEMINYFDYDYPQPETKEVPFEHTVAVTPSPWKEGNKLVHIGIKGYDVAATETPRSNLVFLLDVSGSMNNADKLPLLVNSMKMLLETLSPEDTVGIVVYAGAAGTVLEPTAVKDKQKIIAALENLRAGGSTAGAEGIRQAYQLAESVYDKEAVNRVILATDGDFNVGITNREELKDFIERKRETGIFLSVLGFGQGNYNDHMMQELAQNGNGVAAYIDSLNEARKVLVEEASATLFPIAKDVKIQVEFNPETVAEYRLVGYETRALAREDFNNDAVDAGDIGAGHTVTAIYEITPVGGPRMVDESRYASSDAVQAEEATAKTDFGEEYAFLKMRYKLPSEDTSKLITTPITVDSGSDLSEGIMNETNFATAVATFGQLLKGGKYVGQMDYDAVIKLANEAKGADEFGYRAEFIQLVRLAKSAAALQDTQP